MKVQKFLMAAAALGLTATGAMAQAAVMPDPSDTLDTAKGIIIAAVAVGATVVAWRLGKRALKFIFG